MSPSSKSAATGAAAPGQAETQRAVEQFLYRQADILDDRRWDDWLGLFTEDGPRIWTSCACGPSARWLCQTNGS